MTTSTRKAAERRPRDYDATATKTRLLDVAARLFAEKGHDGVSVRDITSRAKTNIAAIAYHFGGKEDLYVAALRHAVQKTIGGMHEETGAKTTDPLETLHLYVHGMCEAFLGDDADPTAPRLVLRELTAPTGALEMVVDEMMRPNFRKLHATLAALAGKSIEAKDLPMHVFSIVGQIMHYRHTAPIVKRLLGEKSYPPGFAQKVARHVVRLALLGIDRADLLRKEPGR